MIVATVKILSSSDESISMVGVPVRPKRKLRIDGSMCVWKRNDADGCRKEKIGTASVCARNFAASTSIYSEAAAERQ